MLPQLLAAGVLANERSQRWRVPARAQVKAKAEKLGVRIQWMGRRDHLDPALQDYQVRSAAPKGQAPCQPDVGMLRCCALSSCGMHAVLGSIGAALMAPEIPHASSCRTLLLRVPSRPAWEALRKLWLLWPAAAFLHRGQGASHGGPIRQHRHARAQVFINASTSDVVATTSMEALAMGKWLICAHHACNTFVSQFRNCLVYHNPAEFSANLQRALLQEPPPLSPDELRCAAVLGLMCLAWLVPGVLDVCQRRSLVLLVGLQPGRAPGPMHACQLATKGRMCTWRHSTHMACCKLCSLLGQNKACLPCRTGADARPGLCRELGWEAATERMLDAGTIRAGEWPGPFSTAQEAMLWSVYNSFIGARASGVCIPYLLCSLRSQQPAPCLL